MAYRNGISGEAESENETESNIDSKIAYYFRSGFEYKEILSFLSKFHGSKMSMSTLKRRLKNLRLQRRKPNFDIQYFRRAVQALADGAGSSRGYRSIWHSLKRDGISVPRDVVQQLLKEIDPEASESRKTGRLKRRTYRNEGPDQCWHCDGYDKLKPYGFPIHGCIDGFSRKVIWLCVTRSNNSPNNIAAYYLDAVEEHGGCPVNLRTDPGTENGTMAGIQAFFTNDEDSHRYVPSTRNQRIEAWWSALRKAYTGWWIHFFKDISDSGIVDLTSQYEKECLWFCFSNHLQAGLDEIKDHWNTHYIRGSRHETVKGRPDSLYYLPENHGGTPHLKVIVPLNEFEYAKNHLVDEDEDNNFQEYFKYVVETLALPTPRNWREALHMYNILKEQA